MSPHPDPEIEYITLDLLASTADDLGKYVRYVRPICVPHLHLYRFVGIDNDLDGKIGYKLIPDPNREYADPSSRLPHVALFDEVMFVEETFAEPNYSFVQLGRVADIMDIAGVVVARVDYTNGFPSDFVPPWVNQR